MDEIIINLDEIPAFLRAGPRPKPEDSMGKPGPKETALRDARLHEPEKSPATIEGRPAAAAAIPQESSVMTSTKKTTNPAPKARKPASVSRKVSKETSRHRARTPISARPDGLRAGSKQAVMLDMALKPEGATEKTICQKLGWKKCRVTLKRVCEKVGAILTTGKNKADETVYFASFSKKK